MKDLYPLRTLCHVLEVSPSGYYSWLDRREHPGPRASQDALMRPLIHQICQKSRHTYGSPRVRVELQSQGYRVGRARTARLMKEQGLQGRQKARHRIQTTDSDHRQPIAPNRLAEVPKPTGPNQIWVADITFIKVGQDWLYLAAILDRYSRKIVGWGISPDCDTSLVLQALAMALQRRKPPAHLLFHSDRGVQYASQAFREALQAHGFTPSMSRKGNCYDNAFMESFWSSLKIELVYRTTFETQAQARNAIFDYIEGFYNRSRRHSSLGYLSPVDFENKNN